MQELYQQVAAVAIRDPIVGASVKRGFSEKPLIFVPGPAGSGGAWVSSQDVMWKGRRKIFPGKIFIGWHYQVSSWSVRLSNRRMKTMPSACLVYMR